MKNYGFKVCYREQGKRYYVRHFLAYTRRQAKSAMDGYVRYPPSARDDGRILKKPRWKIIPVSRSEVKAGIWREPPF
jgi:hypothetical protein